MCKRLKVGKIYNAFDDGKIKPSRLIKWQIIEELDLEKDRVNKEDVDFIKEEISSYWWLYNKEQRYIYRAKALKEDDTFDKSIGYCFVLRAGDGWFGTGYWACRFDYDGSLYKELLSHYDIDK